MSWGRRLGATELKLVGSVMPFWKLFYHLVWSTKDRRPLLKGEIRVLVFKLLRGKAAALGAVVYALNGTEDHVHMVAAVPPRISLSKFVGQIKAVASLGVNRSGLCEEEFKWQDEYGAFSFDRKRLSAVVQYVQRQEEHHRDRTTIDVLERCREN